MTKGDCYHNLDVLTLKVVSQVTRDVGYSIANLSLPIPVYSQLMPDVRDRQTSDKTIA